MGDYDNVELRPWTPSYKADPRPPKPPAKRGKPTNEARGIAPAPIRREGAERQAYNRDIFRDALNEWIKHPDSIIERIEEVGESAYLAHLKGDKLRFKVSDWQRLALLLPGSIAPLDDNNGAIWMMKGAEGWILVSPARVQSCHEAHSILLNTVPAGERSWSLLPFTYGAIAGRFLKWFGVVAPDYTKAQEKMLLHPSETLAHYRVVPGHYEGPLSLWDVEAYYYSLIQRLPTPLAYVMKKSIAWEVIADDEMERWNVVVHAIGQHKMLRNALWGKMYGSDKPLVSYSRKHPDGYTHNSNFGPFRITAALVARSAHELTQLQSIGGGSVWSHTDAVVLPAGEEPTIWQSKGLKVKREATGDAFIVDTISYRVGLRKKGLIDLYEGSRTVGEVEGSGSVRGDAFPDVQYHSFWL